MLQGVHYAIPLTFIKLPMIIKIFVLSIFEWLFYTGFTVHYLMAYESYLYHVWKQVHIFLVRLHDDYQNCFIIRCGFNILNNYSTISIAKHAVLTFEHGALTNQFT